LAAASISLARRKGFERGPTGEGRVELTGPLPAKRTSRVDTRPRFAFRAKEGRGIQMEMLVGEQEQHRVGLPLDPAGKRSLVRSIGSR
jgi:hypothetical protein